MAEHVGIGGIGPVIVGSPETVADAARGWIDDTDIDGFNLPFAVSPGDFEDVADLLVPELPRRGRYKQAYAAGTLREKLFGAGRARLTSSIRQRGIGRACGRRRRSSREHRYAPSPPTCGVETSEACS